MQLSAGLGFGAGGIVAGSTAASMMSWMAPMAAAGLVATLQSVGAAGLGLAGTTAVAATGGSVGAGVGGAATYLVEGAALYTSETEVGKKVNTEIVGSRKKHGLASTYIAIMQHKCTRII